MRLRSLLPLLALVALPAEAAPRPASPAAPAVAVSPEHAVQARPRRRRGTVRTPYRARSARPVRRSGVRYYWNGRGVRVQAPTYYDRAPSGASAQCRDGTYSFSQSRRGTCSHHGGVASWL